MPTVEWTGRFFEGQRVRLCDTYNVAGGEQDGPDHHWWGMLPQGTEGVIIHPYNIHANKVTWPDASGDYAVAWDHPTAERWQYANDVCLEAVDPPVDTTSIDTIDAWLEGQ